MEQYIAAVPTALRPYLVPVVAAVACLMGFAAMVSFNNPKLRAAVTDHLLWVVFGIILVVAGGAIVTGFAGQLGISIPGASVPAVPAGPGG